MQLFYIKFSLIFIKKFIGTKAGQKFFARSDTELRRDKSGTHFRPFTVDFFGLRYYIYITVATKN